MVTLKQSLKHDTGSISDPLAKTLAASITVTLTKPPFYYHALELQEILGSILAEFYDTSAAHGSDTSLPSNRNPRASIIKAQIFVQRIRTGDFQSLLMFDDALLAWRHKLPHFLRPSYYETPQMTPEAGSAPIQRFRDPKELSIVKRQAVVLHAR